jgi:hypothetical protein
LHNNFKTFTKVDLVPFLLIIILLVFHCLGPPDSAIKNDTPILFPVDSLKHTKLDIASHNSALISALLQREATDQQSYVSALADQGQTRNIYFAIIAVVLTITYSDNSRKRIGEIVILVLIVLMCYVDVHLEDQLKRSDDKNQVTHNAVNSLVNAPEASFTWYRLDYRQTENQLKKASQESFCRKLRLGSQFNIERLVFYIIPWILVYIIATLDLRRKNTTKPVAEVDPAKRRRGKSAPNP